MRVEYVNLSSELLSGESIAAYDCNDWVEWRWWGTTKTKMRQCKDLLGNSFDIYVYRYGKEASIVVQNNGNDERFTCYKLTNECTAMHDDAVLVKLSDDLAEWTFNRVDGYDDRSLELTDALGVYF